MAQVTLTAADHALVTDAVGAAERGTDGEIVTIVARRSDNYRDVALHYAVAAMLLTTAIVGINPAAVEQLVALFTGGWGAPAMNQLLFALLLLQTAVFLAVRFALAWTPLRIRLAPKSTRARRVRRRAVEHFRVGAERRTQARVGVLLYLSLDEHLAEIVADEAIHRLVPPERWGDAMGTLVDQVRAGHPGHGMAAAAAAIGAIIAEHFPKTGGDLNELPDRLIEL